MNSFPTPKEFVQVEPMNENFTKFHLPGLLLHRFTHAEDEHPHNHPWPFTTHILKGGYEEDVYEPQPDGTVRVTRHQRVAGTSHRVEAHTIHKLVRLLDGDAWTIVQPGPWAQKSGFYRFDAAGTWFRYWDEPEFRLLLPV